MITDKLEATVWYVPNEVLGSANGCFVPDCPPFVKKKHIFVKKKSKFQNIILYLHLE